MDTVGIAKSPEATGSSMSVKSTLSSSTHSVFLVFWSASLDSLPMAQTVTNLCQITTIFFVVFISQCVACSILKCIVSSIISYWFNKLQIRSDVNLTLDSTLANIQVKSRNMVQHFDRIDRLEVAFLIVFNVFFWEAIDLVTQENDQTLLTVSCRGIP